MSSRFYACEQNFPRVITRNRAKGYKRLVISEDMQPNMTFQLKTEGTDLVMYPDDSDSDSADSFTILCKEFGLDDTKKFMSDISVIYLDEGYMLLTLHKGSIAINIEKEDGSLAFVAPTLGIEDSAVPSFKTDDVLWCDIEKLMSYAKYMDGYKSIFQFDFEFYFQVGGTRRGSEVFRLRTIADKDIDISLGTYAVYVDTKQKKEEMRKTSKLTQLFQSSGNFEFDDEDEDDDDDGVEYED